MFDAETRALVAAAPPLDGLQPENLPEELARAYVEVVNGRIAAQQGAGQVEAERFLRLGRTYETLVCLNPDAEWMAPAAFVAASSYQLASAVIPELSEPLRPDSVHPSISSMLLFLIGDFASDATAVARSLAFNPASGPAEAVCEAIRLLSLGTVRPILNLPHHSVPGDDERAAANVCWARLLAGLQALAQALLVPGSDIDTPTRMFEDVRRDTRAVLELDLPLKSLHGLELLSLFPGPHHLATLLSLLSNAASHAASSRLPPPTGCAPEAWSDYIRRLCARRPFLWRNHRRAISSGFLQVGRSAVVSMPTGSGKSLLAELKTAATLISGASVVYLAPTLALVSQVARDLRGAIQGFQVFDRSVLEGEYAEIAEETTQTPSVYVMTPERCLALLGVEPDQFENIGLLVFDECHVLDPNNGDNLRRSIDSMLALIGLATRRPAMDLLLVSAMLGNVQDLSAWITSQLNRPCVPLTFDWKPTRQVRGCIVYDRSTLEGLQQVVTARQQNAAKTRPPKPGKQLKPRKADIEDIQAKPMAFLCLRQTWGTDSTDDYVLQPFPGVAALSVSDFWKLTPNRNGVAQFVASLLARSGIKTLVFATDYRAAASVAERVGRDVGTDRDLKPNEQEWLSAAARELGGNEHVYAPTNGQAACHHGLLLRPERQAVEAAFRRADGLSVLSATPTLSQGVNLPAEAVVIAGDDRFDQVDEKQKAIDARDLLNAAGRAGRPGFYSQALVLVIPGRVVGLEQKGASIEVDPRWFELQRNVFSQLDRCVHVTDPIQYCLDLIQQGAAATSDEVAYLARRLAGPVGSEETRRDLLRKSLAAYHAQRAAAEVTFAQRCEALLAMAATERAKAVSRDSVHELAATLGVSAELGSAVVEALSQLEETEEPNTLDAWLTWIIKWAAKSGMLPQLFRMRRLTEGLGKPAAYPDEVDGVSPLALQLIRIARAWLRGEPLTELDMIASGKDKASRRAILGRKFALRSAVELSYGVGAVARFYRSLVAEGLKSAMPLDLGVLGGCVRDGLDSPEKLALHYLRRRRVGATRRATHDRFEEIEPYLDPRGVREEFTQTMGRVRRALNRLEEIEGV